MGVLFEDRMRTGGFETRVLELDGEGPPLLLLHGFSDSADCWRAVIDRLRREGRRAMAVDLPGFATASRLDRERPILPQMDAFVRGVLTRMGERGAVIAGNSLGGCIALRAASNPANGLAGVIPIAPAGRDLARWIGVIQGELLVRGILRSPAPVPRPVVRAVVGQLYRRAAFADTGRIDSRAIDSFTSHIDSRRAAIRVLATGGRLRGELNSKPFEPEKVDCPVLLIWGDHDRMVPVSGSGALLDALPHGRLEILTDYGHCPQVECPERIVELIGEFCDELAPLGAAVG
jgi:pimeloyl-ACP methyl ester carboxylesterase